MARAGRIGAWMASIAVILVFSQFYVRHAFRPLRDGHDSHEYTAIAKAIDEGRPYNHHQWPIGYPLVLVGFWRVGIHGNPGLVIFNLFCLAAGLSFTFAVGRRCLGLSSLELACIGAWVLASRVILDLASIGQPEMAFFATTMLAVLCLGRAKESPYRIAWLAAAILLTVASVSLRNVGIALIPAVLLTTRSLTRDTGRFREYAATTGVAAVLVGAAVFFIDFGLFREAAGPDAQPPRAVYNSTGYVAGVLQTLDTRWEEASEIIANAGYSAGWPTNVRPAGFILGLAFIATAVFGAWRHRRSPATIYLAAYFAILAVWPWYMPRFWVPVLPIVACFAWSGLKGLAERFSWPRLSREVIVVVYCALFVAHGLWIARMST